MLVKIVILFLAALAVIVWVGSKLRLPGPGRKPGLLNRGRCRRCGAPRLGKGRCPCGEA